jgi:hypothetical protein
MKKVSIVKYNLKGVQVSKKTLVHRALYGYTDHSNKGNYEYKRKGVLHNLDYTKISNGVILLETKYVKQLLPIFKRYKIKIKILNLIMP